MPQNGWLQLIGAIFRNAVSSSSESSHPQDWSTGSSALKDPVDSYNGRGGEGGEDECGDDVGDDSC